MNSASSLGQLGLLPLHPSARKMNEPIGRIGVLQAGAERVGDGL